MPKMQKYIAMYIFVMTFIIQEPTQIISAKMELTAVSFWSKSLKKKKNYFESRKTPFPGP